MDLFALDLKYADLAVYLGLLLLADEEGRVVAHQGDIAEEMSMSRSTVSRSIRSLKDAGVIEDLSRGAYRISGPRPVVHAAVEAPVDQKPAGKIDPNSRQWAPDKLPSALTYEEELQFEQNVSEIETLAEFYQADKGNQEIRQQLKEKMVQTWESIYPDEERCARLGWRFDRDTWRWAWFKTIESQTEMIIDSRYNPAEVMRWIRRRLDLQEYEPLLVTQIAMRLIDEGKKIV